MFDKWSGKEFASWFAGFFDGEGCIYLPRGSGITVTVANTNEEIIRAIHSRLGVGVVCTITFSNPKWSTKFVWETKRYDEAGAILKLLRPRLTIKARKADEALARIKAALARRQGQIDRNDAIIAAVEAGETHRSVAARFGIHRTGVTSLISAHRKHGGNTFTKRAPRRPLSSHESTIKLTAKVTTRQTSRTSTEHGSS